MVVPTPDGEVKVKVRWFFVPDDWAFLPVPTVYGSSNWLGDKTGIPSRGEIPGRHTYDKGKRPPQLRAVAYCGSPAAWLGDPDAYEPLELDPVTGYPRCCLPRNVIQMAIRVGPPRRLIIRTSLVVGVRRKRAYYPPVLAVRTRSVIRSNAVISRPSALVVKAVPSISLPPSEELTRSAVVIRCVPVVLAGTSVVARTAMVVSITQD